VGRSVALSAARREKSLGSFCVASALDQDVEDMTVLIHCSPKGVLLPLDGEHHLIHVPCVPTTRATTAHFIGRRLPECEAPLPDGFIGDDDPTLSQKLFDRTES
jgi:hypothetical protein